MVHRLERRSRLHVDEPARGNVVVLWQIAEVHRQRPHEDDERFFLTRMPVSAPLGARLVSPDVGARAGEVGQVAQLGEVARPLAPIVRASDPLEIVWADRAKGRLGRIVGSRR
jgi:hypothetical protein